MTETAFNRGFIKAALANGLNYLQATNLLKQAGWGTNATYGLAGAMGGGIAGAFEGAIPGAILGGGLGAYSETNKEKEQRDMARAIMHGIRNGGLAGATVGGGLGALVGGGEGLQIANQLKG